MRTFLYTRVSTAGQTTDNQTLLAERAGYLVQPEDIFSEIISGTVPAMERPQFKALVMAMRRDDRLIVAKLDRLGRNASDIDCTITRLRDKGVHVVVLDLPVMEVTSAAGDLVRRMFSAFAQFEREQLVERTHAGLDRARSEGKKLGRQSSLSTAQKQQAKAMLAEGQSLRVIGKALGVSHQTILRVTQGALA